jgi:hypothetical protein
MKTIFEEMDDFITSVNEKGHRIMTTCSETKSAQNCRSVVWILFQGSYLMLVAPSASALLCVSVTAVFFRIMSINLQPHPKPNQPVIFTLIFRYQSLSSAVQHEYIFPHKPVVHQSW